MKTFRGRIVLWTTVIAGSVMLAFAFFGNLRYEKARLAQLDDFLEMVASRPSPPPWHRPHWNRTGEDALRELETRLGTRAILLVYAEDAPSIESDSESENVVFWGDWTAAFGTGAVDLPAVRGSFEEGAIESAGTPPFRRGMGRFPQPEVEPLLLFPEREDGRWRFALARFPGYNVLVGADASSALEDVALARRAFAIAFPLALLVLAGCIWIFVTKAISPIARLADAAERVSAKRLDARLESDGEYEELARLIDVFNAMLARLESSFQQATRFSADAAHELRTPLTILQGQLENALQAATDGTPEQTQLAGLLEETLRLKTITRKLLLLARADAGTLDAQREKVNLKALVEENVEDESGIRFEASWPEEPVFVSCDLSLTRQILMNLIGNALKYRFPRESEILFRLIEDDGGVVLEIENECHPIGQEAREGLFDRFSRVDAARNRSQEGTGLGLSLALEFARAQGGELILKDLVSLDRICFALRLPR